jgi:hypothetical protein
MSRDELAGRAMAALISNLSYGAEIQRIFDPEKRVYNAGPNNESPQDYVSRLAYAFADSMLKVRAISERER